MVYYIKVKKKTKLDVHDSLEINPTAIIMRSKKVSQKCDFL